MPVGTSKIGLFGGTTVEAGSQTFNSPGTFTVVPGLTRVSLTGVGGKGNSGTPGGAGYGGSGGLGAPGGFLSASSFPFNPSFYNQSSSTCVNYTQPGYSGASGGAGGFAPSGGAAGTSGTATTVFGQVVGNTGTGGTGGTGGHAGNDGGSGNQATHGNCQTKGNFILCPTVRASGGTSNIGSGCYDGHQGGSATRAGQCVANCCLGPIGFLAWQKVRGGGGGGGGGAGAYGQWPCGTRCSSTYARISAQGGASNPGQSNMGRGGNGGLGGYYCSCRIPSQRIAYGSAGSAGQPGGSPNLAPNYNSPNTAFDGVLGAGGGGGGGGGFRTCSQYVRAQTSTGGGGGGSGGDAIFGNAGNPGNAGGAGSVNCVSVSAGDYPVVVGTCGTVTISWNAQ